MSKLQFLVQQIRLLRVCDLNVTRVLQTNENELWKTVHPSICIYIVIYTFFNVQIGGDLIWS